MARKPKGITCRHCGKPLTIQTAGKRIKEASGIWYYCNEACNMAFFGLATSAAGQEGSDSGGQDKEAPE